MDPLGETQIRSSFVNCSKGEAKRISLPRELGELPWGDLDFLGWRDAGAPDRAYLVRAGTGEGAGAVGITMRIAAGARRNLMRSSACSLYMRGKKKAGAAKRLEETLTLEEQIARTVRNLDGFLGKVTGTRM
jgi:hypothetical protein